MRVSSLLLFVSAFLFNSLLPAAGSDDAVQRISHDVNKNNDVSERILSDKPPPKPHPKPSGGDASGTSASGSGGSGSGGSAAGGTDNGGGTSSGADAAAGGGSSSSGGGSASSSSSGGGSTTGVGGGGSTGGIAGGGGGVNAASGSFVGPAGGAKHTGALVAVGVAAVAGAAIATAFTAKRRVETTTPDHPLKGSLNRRINLFSHLAGTPAAARRGADGSYVNADEVIV